jgi:hypothetical protein
MNEHKEIYSKEYEKEATKNRLIVTLEDIALDEEKSFNHNSHFSVIILQQSLKFFIQNNCIGKFYEAIKEIEPSACDKIIRRLSILHKLPDNDSEDKAAIEFIAGELFSLTHPIEKYEPLFLEAAKNGLYYALVALGQKYLDKSEALRFNGQDKESHETIQKANGFLSKIGLQYKLKPQYYKRHFLSVTQEESSPYESESTPTSLKRKADESWEDNVAKRQNTSNTEFHKLPF